MNQELLAKRRHWTFEQLIDKSSGCWLWTGYIMPNGYGRSAGGKAVTQYAHRYSYEYYKGAIPQGMVIMHSCDVRHCVNPDHLILGTQKDNIADKETKGRANRNCLTDDAIEVIKANASKSNSELRLLAAELGVSFQTIKKVINKK
jgi:hypothetical protein